MKYVALTLLLILGVKSTFSQHWKFLVDLNKKEYFLTNKHYFHRYDSTGYSRVYYSNNEDDTSDTMKIYLWNLTENPNLPMYETFENFTRNNQLVEIPQLDPSELTYQVIFKDSIKIMEYPCGNATNAVEVLKYRYSTSIYYKKQLLFEQNYISSNSSRFWNTETELVNLKKKSLVFVDYKNNKIYSILENLKIIDLKRLR
jgi:hypothetical protein